MTGDPWTPIETTKGEAKALTVDARGFSYRRMSDILFREGFEPAPLQEVFPQDDAGSALVLVARALARGEGGTEGLHERRILMPRRIVRLLANGQTHALAVPSKERINQASLVRKGKRDVTAALRKRLASVRCPPAIWWTPDDDGEGIERV